MAGLRAEYYCDCTTCLHFKFTECHNHEGITEHDVTTMNAKEIEEVGEDDEDYMISKANH